MFFEGNELKRWISRKPALTMTSKLTWFKPSSVSGGLDYRGGEH